MNAISAYLTEVLLTLCASLGVFLFLRPALRRFLDDLCGTADRAQFWLVFSGILLIGLPFLISMNYHPDAQDPEGLFFEITHRLSGNLAGFLFGLVGLGFILTFFALISPRPRRTA